ncbi:MAG TPA: hypothetical protein VE980_09300 [Pyrinomonadaceae bacterium]|nr:hypothetical protein [Pyrinomonadaceae bacterium]
MKHIERAEMKGGRAIATTGQGKRDLVKWWRVVRICGRRDI